MSDVYEPNSAILIKMPEKRASDLAVLIIIGTAEETGRPI
jgi:hypothetical protein